MLIGKLSSPLPREKSSIEAFYANCTKLNSFRESRQPASEFLSAAKQDLLSAARDFQSGDWIWTVNKAYYVIYNACTAILIKKTGKFTKDHGCLFVALAHHELVPKELFEKLSKIYEDVNDYFGFGVLMELRRTSTYEVGERKNVSEEDAKIIIEAAREVVDYASKAVYS